MAVPEYKRDVRLGLTGGSGACSPPLPKWLELRSADVLQRLLKEAQHGNGSKVSKHLQLEQIQLQSPRVQLPIGASQAAQSPCAPIHVESPHRPAMSPVPRPGRHVASQAAQTRHRQLPPQIQALNFSSPKIPAQDPQRHAKSMPDASQVGKCLDLDS